MGCEGVACAYVFLGDHTLVVLCHRFSCGMGGV